MTFSGEATTSTVGTIRTAITANDVYLSDDTWDFGASGPFDVLTDAGVQNDSFALTGDAEITVGSESQSIAALFLDDDAENTS